MASVHESEEDSKNVQTCSRGGSAARGARHAGPAGGGAGDPLESAIDGKLSETVPINTLWVVIAAVFVLFMQAGFAMLEIGFSRAKNAGTGVAKILTNLSIAAICLLGGRLRLRVRRGDAASASRGA